MGSTAVDATDDAAAADACTAVAAEDLVADEVACMVASVETDAEASDADTADVVGDLAADAE